MNAEMIHAIHLLCDEGGKNRQLTDTEDRRAGSDIATTITVSPAPLFATETTPSADEQSRGGRKAGERSCEPGVLTSTVTLTTVTEARAKESVLEKRELIRSAEQPQTIPFSKEQTTQQEILSWKEQREQLKQQKLDEGKDPLFQYLSYGRRPRKKNLRKALGRYIEKHSQDLTMKDRKQLIDGTMKESRKKALLKQAI